ncbi:2-C-methyl-D-erythritol 4-phosphate cytidylyltransferase [Halalkalibacterium ligniniphilum]|uniref:2-C-methyl-D-erythritol 4-phosphate cytidylyltransferase n=1 Tax=Halalkalibacterium ligniniphilum TaxID=1134413 RepID=UPI00034DF440|nr:2-C-methyl-D-erythritol 4-phosphate cytidylyltransferase [Halalkalibacterium ligniniphilum]
MNYSVVIPAAGQGKRMNAGKNKQFIELARKPVIVHTLEVFENDPWCEQMVVVANQSELETMSALVKTYGLSKVTSIVQGGKERQNSVKAGLDQLKGNTVVLIHDGARPFIKETTIHALVEQAAEKGAAIVAVPVKDTVKRVSGKRVEETMKREELWAVQTPQAFTLPLIQSVHQKAMEAGILGTDDASLAEWDGHDVYIVEGDYFNMKLTTPEDVIFAEAILNRKGETR